MISQQQIRGFDTNQLIRFDYSTIIDRIRSRVEVQTAGINKLPYPSDKITSMMHSYPFQDTRTNYNYMCKMGLTIDDLKYIFEYESIASRNPGIHIKYMKVLSDFFSHAFSNNYFDTLFDPTVGEDDFAILQNILCFAQSLNINICGPDCLPQEKRHALISKPPINNEPLNDEYREQKRLNTPARRTCLPDNGWRMIQLLEKYSMNAWSSDKEKYTLLINRLMKAMYEGNVTLVFQDIQKQSSTFDSRQLQALELATR